MNKTIRYRFFFPPPRTMVADDEGDHEEKSWIAYFDRLCLSKLKMLEILLNNRLPN